MFYCHDAYGIGHVKRALAIGRYLTARWPAASQLVVSSAATVSGSELGERVDYVKLPSLRRIPSRDGDPGYVPHALPISVAALMSMRRDLLLGIVRHLHPDLLVVDHTPAGLAGELVPSLRHLREASPGTRFVAGLRDIVGDPERVREAWTRDGVYELLDNLYDRILVYGQRDVYDLVAQTGLSTRAADKVRYTGYLGRDKVPSSRRIREDLEVQTEKLVLVTAGGGADGHAVLRPMLEARRAWPERARFDCVLVGGPLMPPSDRRRLEQLVPSGSPTRFIPRVDDLVPYVSAADVVVARGGYNTACEILTFGRPAIIVPRETINGVEDREQLMRAQALAGRGLVQVIRESELTPDRLLQAVNRLLDAPAPAGQALGLDGLPAAAAELEGLLAGRRA